MNTGIVCEECHKPHTKMVEVKATAFFRNRKNEWVTHFCPKCLEFAQKQWEVEKWRRKENKT